LLDNLNQPSTCTGASVIDSEKQVHIKTPQAAGLRSRHELRAAYHLQRAAIYLIS